MNDKKQLAGTKIKDDIIPVILIIVLYFTGNFIWFSLQNIRHPLNEHEASHFDSSVQLYEGFRNNTIRSWDDFIYTVYTDGHSDAPFNPLFAAVINSMLGKNYMRMLLLMNIFYFSIAVFFTYRTGSYIMGAKGGLMGAVFLSMYPAVYGISRRYSFDFGVMAAVALSIYLLLRSEKFSNRKMSMLFGVSLAWGMLIKWTFAAFLFGPVLFSAIEVIRENIKKSRINLFLSLLTAIIVSAPYQLSVSRIFTDFEKLFHEAKGPWYHWENLRVYTVGVSDMQLSPLYFLLFVTGLYIFIKKFDNSYIKKMFVSLMVIPWMILIVMPHNKNTVHAIPYFPVVACITSYGIMNLSKKFIPALLSVSVLVGIVQYFSFSYGIIVPHLDSVRIGLKPDMYIHYFCLSDDMLYYRHSIKHVYERIYDVISERKEKTGKNSYNILLLNTTQRYFIPGMYVLKHMEWFRDADVRFVSGMHVSVLMDFEPDVDNDLAPGDIDGVIYAGYRDFGAEESYMRLCANIMRKADDYPLEKEKMLDPLVSLDYQNMVGKYREFAEEFQIKEKLYSEDGTDVYIYLR
ncbi:MAG: glycosyltransferase family 39 protein [Elusimicrobia bacterium]|nr:glycosyltransferase family 39 protein [Elusimicrobiota bacterium]